MGRRRPEFGVPDQEVIEYGGPDRSWAEEWKEFVSAIRDERRPLGDGYDGWQALRLVRAAYESAEQRRAITLS